MQEEKQTNEDREYETSPIASDGENEDTMCSRKSNSLQDKN